MVPPRSTPLKSAKVEVPDDDDDDSDENEEKVSKQRENLMKLKTTRKANDGADGEMEVAGARVGTGFAELRKGCWRVVRQI